MRKEYDFSKARRGAILPVATGKTRITIRIDDDVLEWFRQQVHEAGGGNYQTLINDALLEHVHRQSTLDVVRQAVREELVSYGVRRGSNIALQRKRRTRR